MVKKLFALASVTALAGLVSAVGVAGCSETVVENPATPDSGTDAGKTKGDSGPITGDDDDDTEEPLCYDEKPVEGLSEVKYNTAKVVPGACKASVEQTIKTFIDNNQSGTWDDLKAEITAKEGATCSSCVFSKDSDAKWAPIVQADSGGASINIGGCVEMASGKEACGRAVYVWNLCLTVVCDKCEEGSTCGQDAQATACKEATDAVTAECGNNINSYLKACGNLFGAIKAQCVADGGGDGGPDAN